MVLNLLLSQTPEDIRNIFENSLAMYQHTHGNMREKAQTNGLDLWKDFQKHISCNLLSAFLAGPHR